MERISQKYLQVQDDHSLSRSDPGTLKLSLLLTIKWQRFICNLVQCLSKSLCNQGVVCFFFPAETCESQMVDFLHGPRRMTQAASPGLYEVVIHSWNKSSSKQVF